MKTRSSGSKIPASSREYESETSDLDVLDNDILSGRRNVKTMGEYRALRYTDDTLAGTGGKNDNKEIKKTRIKGCVDKYISRHYRRARRYGNAIRRRRVTLLAIQFLYGLKILDDWKSKTAAERSEVLRKVKPAIPTEHGMDLRFYHSHKRDGSQEQNKARDAVLMPHVNVADLQMGYNLPILARSRAFTEPHNFVALDYSHLKWAQQTFINGPIKIPGQFIWLGEDSKFKSYGDMVESIDNHEASAWPIRGTGLDPEAGLLLLETQKNIYEFLVRCCVSLLSTEEKKQCKKLQEEYLDLQKQPGGLEAVQETPWELPLELEDEDIEEPYLEPIADDLVFILKSLIDRREDEEEHWKSLRQDPAYFASIVKERHFGKIVGKNPNPNTNPLNTAAFERAVKDVFRTDLRSWIMWTWLGDIAASVAHNLDMSAEAKEEADAQWDAAVRENPELLNTAHDTTDKETNANDELHYRILQLQAWLEKSSDVYTQSLLTSAYDIDRQVWQTAKMQTGAQQVSKKDKAVFRWLRDALQSPHQIIPFTKTARALKWYVNHGGMGKHVSTRFADVVEDMNFVCDYTEALSRVPEWRTCQHHDPTQHLDILKEFDAKIADFEAAINKLDMHDVAEKCQPLEKKLDSPSSETGTEDLAAWHKSAQDLLNELMLPLENLINNFAAPGAEETEWAGRFRDLWTSSTPEIADVAEANPEDPRPAADDDNSDEPAENAEAEQSAAFRVVGARSNRRRGRAISKRKERDDVASKLPTKFKCDKKAYEVFQILFDKETAGRKSLKMEEFSYAMENIGFKKTKLAGSGFKYTYTSASGSTTFVEHGPHGSMGNTFPKNIIRDLAARLKKIYGWSMKTFELEETKS